MLAFLFSFNDPPPTEIYTLSLHDALPILKTGNDGPWLAGMTLDPGVVSEAWCHQRGYVCLIEEFGGRPRSEEHTSELQSRRDLVCRLLLEKKKKKKIQ